MIKAIIFDCFGVLTKDMWKEFCDSLPEGEVLDEAHRLNHQYDAAKMSLDDFAQAVHKLSARPVTEIKAIFTGPKSNKNMELLEYIKSLKNRYKIGMLSNVGTDWIRERFLTPDEQRLFDAMIFSFEVGITKPNPQIFILAAQRLGAQLGECVFVDDREGYVEAAANLGMKGIVYNGFAQMKVELEKYC